jgi:hypothetical protein
VEVCGAILVRGVEEEPLTVDDMIEAMPDIFNFGHARQQVGSYQEKFQREAAASAARAENLQAEFAELEKYCKA